MMFAWSVESCQTLTSPFPSIPTIFKLHSTTQVIIIKCIQHSFWAEFLKRWVLLKKKRKEKFKSDKHCLSWLCRLDQLLIISIDPTIISWCPDDCPEKRKEHSVSYHQAIFQPDNIMLHTIIDRYAIFTRYYCASLSLISFDSLCLVQAGFLHLHGKIEISAFFIKKIAGIYSNIWRIFHDDGTKHSKTCRPADDQGGIVSPLCGYNNQILHLYYRTYKTLSQFTHSPASFTYC